MKGQNQPDKPQDHTPRRTLKILAAIGLITAAGLATASPWNPLSNVSTAVALAGTPVLIIHWLFLYITGFRGNPSPQLAYTTAAAGVVTALITTAIAVSISQTYDNSILTLTAISAATAFLIFTGWQFTKATFRIAGNPLHIFRPPPKNSQN